MLLEEWDILKEELFLQVLGAGGDDHAFAASDHRQQIGQSLARSRAGFYDQVPALTQRFFHGFRHLQLATAELVIRMRPAQQSSGREELVQRRQAPLGSGSSFGIGSKSHGQGSLSQLLLGGFE